MVHWAISDTNFPAYIYTYIYIEDNKYYLNNIMEKVIPKSKTKFLQNFFWTFRLEEAFVSRTTDEGFFKSKRLEKVFKKFCFRFWNYFLHYIIQIIFIVFNIYSVDESDLQRDEVAIIKVFVKYIYIYIYMTYKKI